MGGAYGAAVMAYLEPDAAPQVIPNMTMNIPAQPGAGTVTPAKP
jgi:hypothetical protein